MTKPTYDDYELQKKLLDSEIDADDTISNPKAAVDFKSKQRRENMAVASSSCASAGRCLCMCALITLVVLLVLALVAFGGIYFWTKNVVEHLTVTDSKTFPIVSMSDTEVDYFTSRVKVFMDELLMEKEPQEDLIITQDEINGLLGQSDYLRGNMYITLTEGKVYEEYSLPMSMFPGGKDRFFLGHDYTSIDETAQRVELKMETAAKHEDWFIGPLYFLQLHFDGKDFPEYHQHLLELFIENGSFFGNPIPDDFIDQHLNLLEGAYNDPDSGKDFRAVIDGIESVSVHERQIVIKPRRHHDAEGVIETVVVMEEHDPRPDPPVIMEKEEDPNSNVGATSMLRATNVQPARPKNTVQSNLRVVNSNP